MHTVDTNYFIIINDNSLKTAKEFSEINDTGASALGKDLCEIFSYYDFDVEEIQINSKPYLTINYSPDSKAWYQEPFLDELSEYVLSGSFVHWRGEDGYEWRNYFKDGKMINQIVSSIVWKDVDDDTKVNSDIGLLCLQSVNNFLLEIMKQEPPYYNQFSIKEFQKFSQVCWASRMIANADQSIVTKNIETLINFSHICSKYFNGIKDNLPDGITIDDVNSQINLLKINLERWNKITIDYL